MIEELALRVRRATRSDIPVIVRLLADDMLGHHREHVTDPLPLSYFTAFEAIDRDEHQELVVVENSDGVIGTLHLSFLQYLTYQGGLRAQIEAVRVAQPYRRHGVGQFLCSWAIRRAREKHCHMVQLTTHANRSDAHRLYERLGFVPSHIGMKLELHLVEDDTR